RPLTVEELLVLLDEEPAFATWLQLREWMLERPSHRRLRRRAKSGRRGRRAARPAPAGAEWQPFYTIMLKDRLRRAHDLHGEEVEGALLLYLRDEEDEDWKPLTPAQEALVRKYADVLPYIAGKLPELRPPNYAEIMEWLAWYDELREASHLPRYLNHLYARWVCTRNGSALKQWSKGSQAQSVVEKKVRASYRARHGAYVPQGRVLMYAAWVRTSTRQRGA